MKQDKMLNRTTLFLIFFFFFCFVPSGENEWKFDGNVGHFTDLFSFSCTSIPLLITVVSDRINGENKLIIRHVRCSEAIDVHNLSEKIRLLMESLNAAKRIRNRNCAHTKLLHNWLHNDNIELSIFKKNLINKFIIEFLFVKLILRFIRYKLYNWILARAEINNIQD